jgi:cyanate permease
MYYFFFVRFILFTSLTTWGIIALISWLSRLIAEGGTSARYTAAFLLIVLLMALPACFMVLWAPSRIL